MGNIRNRRDTPIARHVWDTHNGEVNCISFKVIEVVRPSPRKGDLNQRILQKETRWIYRLKTMEPQGLNEQLSFKKFLDMKLGS